MTLIKRIHALYAAKKSTHALIFTPTERLICEAEDQLREEALALLWRHVDARLDEMEARIARAVKSLQRDAKWDAE